MDEQLEDGIVGLPQGEEINREGMQWFVVHCLTGQEMRSKRYIDAQKITEELSDSVGMVVVPTERVTETRQNKKRTISRKFFPGYLLVQAAIWNVPNPAKPHKKVLNIEVWRFIKDTPGIIGFLGGDKPSALSEREVSDIFEQTNGEEGKTRVKIDYKVGEIVQITDGAFKGSSGPIDKVDPDRGKLNVTVTVFGRPIAVELEYWQVERQEIAQPTTLG